MLNDNMKRALFEVACGVRKYKDGYRSVDDLEPVDGRSLEALSRRGLVNWKSTGASRQVIKLGLTEKGKQLFDELEDELWSKFRKKGY